MGWGEVGGVRWEHGPGMVEIKVVGGWVRGNMVKRCVGRWVRLEGVCHG